MPRKLCGNCFSMVKGKICTSCGNTIDSDEADYDALPVGTQLNSRYTIGRILGRGGFGIIYLAYDEKTDSVVAIKEFFPYGTAVRSFDSLAAEPMTSKHAENYQSGMKRFIYEAEIISKFKECTDIIGIYDVFCQNNTAYYAMEYVKGISLKKYIENNGTITDGQAVYIAKSILPALAAAHSKNVLHRDVSPDNIMLCENGKIRLIDFGSAHVINDKQQSMSVVLKHGFAPVEQYQRKGNQGSWTDLYSLGASLFFALTGIPPEDSLVRMESDRNFNEALASVSPLLSVIIAKAADVKIENRYSQAEDMLSDLNCCGIGEEIIDIDILDFKDIEKKPDVLKFRRRKAGIIVAIASVLSVLLISAVVAVVVSLKAPVEVKIGGVMYPVNVTELDLSDRELTNAQIANLQHLDDLVYLNLDDNYITDLSCLDGLTKLEELYFSNNNVSDISFMKSMMNLRSVSAENNSISDISVLADKTMLENVFFGDNFVTDVTPLSNSRNLKKIGFNEAQIGDLEAFRGMTEIEMVCLSGCGLSDISPLSECKNLKYVYLGRNKLDDISMLADCELIDLYVDNNLLEGKAYTFYGLNVSDIIAAEGNGFTEGDAKGILSNTKGNYVLYY